MKVPLREIVVRAWSRDFFPAMAVAAAASTMLIVWAGWDEAVRRWTNERQLLGGPEVRWYWWWLGNLWHVIPGLILAFAVPHPHLRCAGWAVLWALLLTFLLVLLLKTTTGRYAGWLEADALQSFHFLEFREWGRVYMKWPSGHTASAVTAAAALHRSLPEKRWIPWLCYPLAGLMGCAMIDGDYHWLSDVVAAWFLALPVGWASGRVMRVRGDS